MAAEDDTQRQLGILIGQVGGIARRLDDIDKRLDRSDESRKGLHGRMDALAEQAGAIKAKVDTVETKIATVAAGVDEMRPEVALVRGLKTKAWGAVVVLGSIGAFGAWLFQNFWEPIRAGLARMFH